MVEGNFFVYGGLLLSPRLQGNEQIMIMEATIRRGVEYHDFHEFMRCAPDGWWDYEDAVMRGIQLHGWEFLSLSMSRVIEETSFYKLSGTTDFYWSLCKKTSRMTMKLC